MIGLTGILEMEEDLSGLDGVCELFGLVDVDLSLVVRLTMD